MHLEQAFTRQIEAGVNIKASKSSFCYDELECLGSLINCKVVKELLKKVKAIGKMLPINNLQTIVQFHRNDKFLQGHLAMKISLVSSIFIPHFIQN